MIKRTTRLKPLVAWLTILAVSSALLPISRHYTYTVWIMSFLFFLSIQAVATPRSTLWFSLWLAIPTILFVIPLPLTDLAPLAQLGLASLAWTVSVSLITVLAIKIAKIKTSQNQSPPDQPEASQPDHEGA